MPVCGRLDIDLPDNYVSVHGCPWLFNPTSHNDNMRSVWHYSAEELVRQGWHQNSSLPIRGVKDYAPDGSWIEDKRLEVTLRDRASYLEEERVAKL